MTAQDCHLCGKRPAVATNIPTFYGQRDLCENCLFEVRTQRRRRAACDPATARTATAATAVDSVFGTTATPMTTQVSH